MPVADHKPHQTTSNFCIPTEHETIFVTDAFGHNGIYRTIETATRYGRVGAPIYEVTLTWRQVG